MNLTTRRPLRDWKTISLLAALAIIFSTGVSVRADTQAVATRQIVQQTTGATASASAEGAIAYAGPGKGFWWIGTIRPNESVPILGISPDKQFWLVHSRNGDGWVSILDVTTANSAGVAT